MATSLFNFMGNIGIIIGPLVGGYFVQYYSYSAAFLVAGAIELVSLGINVFVSKRLQFLYLYK
jgi:MFS family permease